MALAQADAGSWLVRHRAPARLVQRLVDSGHVRARGGCLRVQHSIEPRALHEVISHLLRAQAPVGPVPVRHRTLLFGAVYRRLFRMAGAGPAPAEAIRIGFEALAVCPITDARVLIPLLRELRHGAGPTVWRQRLASLVAAFCADPTRMRDAVRHLTRACCAVDGPHDVRDVLRDLITRRPGAGAAAVAADWPANHAALEAGVQGYFLACAGHPTLALDIRQEAQALVAGLARIETALVVAGARQAAGAIDEQAVQVELRAFADRTQATMAPGPNSLAHWG
ncbi:hypothetical protein JI739_08090 [Ramlibacter sp. AW1]|uniref:Uncharacterized protein n=1 Tax=Ramlibacter aurantiacus TaxID=2801330 RepID=A0A936ZMA8_9BURK|nr:hypothetical protein [Ramlibacter aurantiacus]MBL0420301.1 hypothetical protein [Ramlibacter aurantiacus]